MKSNTYKTGVSSGHWLSLWLICLVVLSWTPPAQAEPVCARVKIEIQQELILERQAFDAMMKINNNLDTLAIDNVQVSVNFKDDAGNSVVATSDPNNTSAKFFIRIDSMTDISDVNGNGRVEPNTTGEIRWLIIPTTSAAVTPTGTLYYIGATLSYTLGGVPETVEVTPDFITVKPLPQLALDYFLTKQVIGDDPFTAPIEPSEPYTLGVRVRNNGLATAANVRIDSAQPEIKDNPQGLLIDFTITGSSVDDQPSEPVLLINFGDVAPDSAKMGRWDMLTSLAGEFISFSASMSHADELGGAATSILDQPVTHFLVRNVRVDEPGRDAVRDFLALDGQVLRVYESDNTSDEVVTDQSGAAGLDAGAPSGGDMLHTLTIPPTAGFAYVKLPDPYNGNSAVKDVIRSDGKRIPLDNAWTSKERDRSTNPPTYTYFINLFDSNVTGNYSVRMGSGVLGPVPPVVQAIANRTTSEGIQVGFLVEASDPNGQPVALSANPLPVGAAFVDNGNGTATFNWTPAVGQAGAYTITFTATDGFLSASRSPTLTVNPEWDTDGDGMDDAWEMANFGTLDRNGSGDFDGDGVPDLAEYQNGTDPTSAQVAVPPVISPPAGTYADYVEISLSSPTPNTLIYYTLDGTVPTASAFLYAGPVTVSSDTTLQAITVGNGYADSTVSTASYLITGGGPFQQDNSPQQLLVVEAEHYSATQTPGAESWSPDYTLDYSGDSAMVAQPDSGNRVASSDIANSPSLDYQVNFLTTGTHYVWVRGLAVDADGDTIHVGLDGMAFSTSDKLQLASNVLNTWGWTRTTEDGPVASFDVASTGEHTLQIWMDKDGALVDRILITTDPDYIPSNAGPAESLTNSSNGVPVLQAVADQNGVYNGVVTLALAANDPDTDTLTYSASGLPTGLLIDSVSGAISGAIDPTNAASNNVAVTVSGGSDSVTTAFSWNIVAQDIVVPTVTAPADVIAEATALTTPVSLGGPATALDDIDGSLAVTNDAPAAFPLGETFVTYSAADSAGNIGSATQRVTVQDTTPPTLVVPDDIVVISSAALSVNIGTATASDIFGPVIISNDAPALFTVGETLVTWTSTDANGNTGTAQQRITVTLVAPQDSDGDGVSDSNDLCPNTPVGESVDTSGCSDSQRDSDNDGVPDVADVCPLTPAGEPVDASGCSPSQVDSDADGVVDSSDLCPATVAGDPVDVNGCSATQEAVWDYDYPYVNGFEVVTSVHDSVLDSNPANDINGQDDWKLEGVWGMNTDHGNWTSAAGVWHLDGNPAEIDLSRYNVSQWATMNGYVTVPVDAAQPTLSYRYKLELLSGDNMYVRIQTQGSNAWTTIRSYNWRNSHSEYVRDEIDLSSYAGQAVRIRFDQRNGSGSSTRLWVIDDFQIGEPPLASYAYPYSNDFETAAADWDTQGVWAVATNHNGWTSQSGVMHLDGNPGEIDLSRYNVAQWATLNGYIPIPVDAVQPTLSYAYKLGLLSGDNMYVRIQTQGSNAWTTIRSYNWHNDHSEYVREEVDLSAYIGQAIRIRFDQRNGSGNGSRLWVIDDFQIGVPPLASYAYPYSNDFETSVTDWNTQGAWAVTTDHNVPTGQSGVSHLDGNPGEIDLSRYNVAQWATLNGYISIPVDAVQPTLSYGYQLDVLSGDNMYVRIQTQGSNAWKTIRSYNWRNNHSEYVREEIDLSSYAGQAIRIRFDQRNGSASGSRLWVIDDVQVVAPPVASYGYPYSNDFETDTNDWNTQGIWSVNTDHGTWSSNSGSWHLDGNSAETDLSRYNVAQWATLNGYITIPVAAVQPTLSYAYKLGLLSGDNMYVRIQTQGSNAWKTIRSYNWRNDHSEYVREEIDLSSYAGQAIRIRFDQRNGSGSGTRLWVIDDVQVGEPPVASYAYPYSNDFETAAADWNMQGVWSVATDHNAWTSQSGFSHLDGNSAEIDLSRYNVAQWATLNGYISIPVDAVQPTLSYGYQLDVLSGDNMYVRIQTQGSNAWKTIRSYNWRNNHSEYVREEIDLSSYAGQAIRIRFDQRNGSASGPRLWVIDDVQVSEPPVASYAYPYSNDFETAAADWNTQGVWSVATDHNGWTSQSGVMHLDGNPAEIDLSRYNVAQWATLNGYISIPVDAVQPTLSYGYQLDVLSGDNMYVRIQTQGSNAWKTIRSYNWRNDHSEYVREEIDLSSYAGQAIRIRFDQRNGSGSGTRLWVIDDVQVGEPPVASYAYPYSNDFETAAADWNIQGVWSVATDHNGWTSQSGVMHLDGNPAETDLSRYNVAQWATLNGYITIPLAALQPMLSYGYQLDLLSGDNMYVRIQEQGDNTWTTVRSYNLNDNTTGYVLEQIDLSAYTGKAIRIRFDQRNGSGNGTRLWVVDDLQVGG